MFVRNVDRMYIYIYIHDPCLVVFHPGFGVFAEIATSCIVFTSGIPRTHTKSKDAEDQNRVKFFSFEIIMAGTFPTVHHVETQQRQHPAIPTPFPSGFLDSLLLAFLESVLTLRSNCAVK